jgi:hypothetical protein
MARKRMETAAVARIRPVVAEGFRTPPIVRR